MRLLLDAIKVILNAIQNNFGLSFTNFLDKPLKWVAIALALIAAIFSACASITKWNNVFWDRARIGAGQFVVGLKRYPVVGSESVPQTRWSTANRTAMLPIIKASLPVLIVKGHRQGQLGGSSLSDTESGISRVPPMPTSVSLIHSLLFSTAIVTIALKCFLSHVFRVGVALARNFSLFFSVSFAPFAVRLVGAFAIFAFPLSFGLASLFWVFSSIAPVVFDLAFSVCLVIAFCTLAFAGSAGGRQRIFAIFANKEILGICEQHGAIRMNALLRFGAVLKRRGDVQHCNLLSSLLGNAVGTAPRKAVVRRVIKPSQAHLKYIAGVA